MMRLWFAFSVIMGLGALIWQGAERMYNQGVTDSYQRCKADSMAVEYWRINNYVMRGNKVYRLHTRQLAAWQNTVTE